MLSPLRNEKGNWTLIGLLVAVAVGMALLFVVLLPSLTPGKQAEQQGLVKAKPGQTMVGASMDKAKETQCSSNLRQIRISIDSYRAENSQPPATLQDLRMQVSPAFFTCPVSGQPYQYDASTGTVKCPTPGHERL